MNLVIDWGNSSLKVGWFNGPELTQTHRYESSDALLAAVGHQRPDHVIASSTSRSAEEIKAGLPGLSTVFMVLNAQTPLPIGNAYDTPHTLGADRVAAAAGATALFPGQDCLILDLGTCLTADFIDRQAVFQGGLISPGLPMRFRAMHEQTARLPLVDRPDSLVEWPGLTAKNTRQAMQSGVMNGLAFELTGIIDAYRSNHPGLIAVLCGGDGPAFESRLKPPIFAVPDLVLIGLNTILRYNVNYLQASTPDTIN